MRTPPGGHLRVKRIVARFGSPERFTACIGHGPGVDGARPYQHRPGRARIAPADSSAGYGHDVWRLGCWWLRKSARKRCTIRPYDIRSGRDMKGHSRAERQPTAPHQRSLSLKKLPDYAQFSARSRDFPWSRTSCAGFQPADSRRPANVCAGSTDTFVSGCRRAAPTRRSRCRTFPLSYLPCNKPHRDSKTYTRATQWFGESGMPCRAVGSAQAPGQPQYGPARRRSRRQCQPRSGEART